MFARRLASHALLSVVVLAFVVGLMLSAAIALAYTRNAEILLYKNYIKGYRNMQSAQEYFFSLQSKIPVNVNIDLYQTGDDSIQIRSCHWGLWEAAGFKCAVIKNRSVEKSMIYGCLPADKFKSALWLPMASYGVGLTGSAYIKGDCYVSEGGVRPNISVGGYASTVAKHLEGNSYKCDPSILQQTAEQTTYLNNLQQGNFAAVFTEPEMYVKHTTDSIYRSFSQPTLCIALDNANISLSSVRIKGNCVLYSKQPLSIPASARLEQVQIIAPVVFIEPGFKGSIHVLASDSIYVGEGAMLQYPSSLVLNIKTFRVNGTNIAIKNSAVVNGIIYSYQAVPDMQRSMIRISELAITRGIIYSNGFVELKGKHIGNITTAGFQYKNRENTLTNVLPMGTIDFTELSKHFVIPVLTDKKTIYSTACWIEE
jgi:hypothetical protein